MDTVMYEERWQLAEVIPLTSVVILSLPCILSLGRKRVKAEPWTQ